MNDQDELQRQIGSTLRDQAGQVGGVGFGFDAVKARAGRIRRNRRIAGGIAVAATLAVVAPTALAVGGAFESGREIGPAPEPDPSPTRVVRTALTLDGVERGEAPAVEYFTPDGVVLPDQGLQRLDGSYQAVAPSETHGGWIAVEPDGQGIRYFSKDFEPQGGSDATLTFVTTPDRGWLAWVVPESVASASSARWRAQTLVLHSATDPDGFRSWDLPDLPIATPVGFVAEDRVVYEASWPDGETGIFIAEPDGSSTQVPGYVGALSAHATTGLLAVQTKANEDASGCFGVVDVAVSLEEPVWETCEHSLGAFSPDGRWVMASSAYRSGLGPAYLDILDAQTGDVVAQFRQSRKGQIGLIQPVWESSASILSLAQDGSLLRMIRMGIDGSLKEVLDPVETEWAADQYYYLGSDRTSL